jgi:hypothetical protein
MDADKLRNEMASWYVGLDDRTKAIFDHIYNQEPRLVLRAVAPDNYIDDDEGLPPGATLGEVLNPDGATSPMLMLGSISGYGHAIDPEGPDASTPFTIRWTESGFGGTLASYGTQVVIRDANLNEVFNQRVDFAGLEQGAEAARELQVPNGLPAGTYRLEAWHNVDGGSDPTTATLETGVQTFSGLDFGVGGFDPNRPSDPGQANQMALGDTVGHLYLITDQSEDNPAPHLADALESYAGMLSAGLTEGDNLMPQVLEMAGRLRALQVTDHIAFRDAILPDIEETKTAMEMVSTYQMSPDDGAMALLGAARNAETKVV